MRLFLLLCCCAVAGCAGARAKEVDPKFRARVRVRIAQDFQDFVSSGVDNKKPDKVPRSQCNVCNGSGTVLSGDGLHRVSCSNCYDDGSSLLPPIREIPVVRKMPPPVEPKKPDPPAAPPKEASAPEGEAEVRTGPLRRAGRFFRRFRIFRCRR